ncbi:MAG: GGDEF domain-containing phosphodiesterase [Lachnospiraceae bacterium]|nr:GGDEF domain-containing phosphodiesterase [Lachnospiraceae bacterium]
MSDKNQKKYRKIKRSHIGESIIEFVLFSVLAAVMTVLAGRSFASYIVDSKIAAEYDRIKYMARIYDNSVRNKDNNIYNLLVEEGRDYIITNSNNELTHVNGINTISDAGGYVKLPGYDEKVFVYRDKEKGFIYPTTSEKLAVDYMGFRDWASDEANEEATDLEAAAEDDTMIMLPVWISVDLEGGNSHLIGKAVFSASKRDINMLMALAGAMAVLTAIILITLLFNAIKNVVRQRRMISVFFTDVATDGHNWNYFMVNGNRILKRGCNARAKYAVVNLVFVNYRNYCVAHTIADGDKALCKIYNAINSFIGRREMCAHTSSSSFALMLRYNNQNELEARLNKLIDKLSHVDEDHIFDFQAGVALTDKTYDEHGNRIKNKDISLDNEYNNASAARENLSGSLDSGIAFFDDKMIEEQKWLDTVKERQQAALDNEEFKVYYQPKYDPQTGKLRGAEALIRWNSPEFGLIPPGRFIPIFEKDGFITSIDHYMISHVAADQKEWLDKGYKCVPVSVNVSRAHFIESDLAEQIRDMVDKAGTPHEYIEIELTESAFFDDKKAMLTTIGKLKGYGFAVSMDDFGSGYSSLNSLKDMPLDVLKLDAEFFRGDTADSRGQIVVSEAIKLGKQLNMRIVAEGVEVKEQVDFLAGEGCDMIQGYYFAKPMPKSDYELKMDAPEE